MTGTSLLAAALFLSGVAGAKDPRAVPFEETLAGHRDSLNAGARGARLKGLAKAPALARRAAHGRAGDPCGRHPELSSTQFRWVFTQEALQFYVKHPPLEIDFGPGACDAYYPPPEAHHGDTPQAIRRLPGDKDFDLVLYSDGGSDEVGVILLTKEGLQAVSYGYIPLERLLGKIAVKLPKLPVARSLTQSMKGEALLVVLPKRP